MQPGFIVNQALLPTMNTTFIIQDNYKSINEVSSYVDNSIPIESRFLSDNTVAIFKIKLKK